MNIDLFKQLTPFQQAIILVLEKIVKLLDEIAAPGRD